MDKRLEEGGGDGEEGVLSPLNPPRQAPRIFLGILDRSGVQITPKLLKCTQGQIVISYAYLNFDFNHRQEELPVKKARVYRVTHVADETKICYWIVTKIEDVTDGIVNGEVMVPEVFKTWSDDSISYDRVV